MNYFEFKRILDADPYSQDPDFLHTKEHDARCRKAYQQAMAEEQLLLAALNVPVPSQEINGIRFQQTEVKTSRFRNQFLAMAASVLVVFGFGFLYLNNNQGSDLERFINEALLMEPEVYMSDAEIPHETLAPLFASLNTEMNGDLGQVHFMKLCPTLDGTGARMVIMNELSQPITVLYMPNSPVDQAIDMEMEGYKGKIVALDHGSAAIIARPHQSTALVEANLQTALKQIN